MIALVVDENLGLVRKTAEGGRVHDAVAVALKFGAVGAFGLGMAAPPALGWLARERRALAQGVHRRNLARAKPPINAAALD